MTTVTVKQAALMICPFIRDWDYAQHAPENAPPVYEHIKCRGPACMGWRWWNMAPEKGERQGFCGAAGDQ